MAKKISRKTSRTIKRTESSPFKIYWNKTNYILLLAGVALLIIGFYMMSIGNWDSVTALVFSPIVLLIAYIIIFPASIFFSKTEKKGNGSSNEGEDDSGQS